MRLLAPAALLFATLAAATSALADVVITDTEFSDSVWVTESIAVDAGGSASAAQSSGTGNPGNARRVTLTPSASGTIWGFSRYGNTNATRYVPSTDGAIASIAFSFDASLVDGFGQGQSVAIALKQGQVTYAASFAITGAGGGWQTFSNATLVAANFSRLDGLAGIPNFSAAGAPIRFGFASGNTALGTSYTTIADYDNFSVTIRQVPGPASILALAGLVALRRRR
jgi:hypothetical protein